MAKSKLPTSTAKTAYGLLSAVAKLALDEPKRMSMAEWRVKANTDQATFSTPRRGFPRCGTVGCIGGWVETLVSDNESASTALGLYPSQEDELFFDSVLCGATNQQTKSHALAVARHIRKFQKKYRAQLIAKKVKP